MAEKELSERYWLSGISKPRSEKKSTVDSLAPVVPAFYHEAHEEKEGEHEEKGSGVNIQSEIKFWNITVNVECSPCLAGKDTKWGQTSAVDLKGERPHISKIN